MSLPGKGWAQRPVLVLALAILGLCAVAAEASRGDGLYVFRDCVQTCKVNNCNEGSSSMHIPLHRRLLFWDCPAECDYLCQHIVTANRVAAGDPVVQFHGKWPFIRVLGIQEPLSVLFSLGNLWAHATGLRRLRAAVPAGNPLLRYYKAFAWVGVVTWVASAVFHTRDFKATEELDYFAAGASVLYGLYYTFVRVFGLYRRSSPALGGGRGRGASSSSSVLRYWTLTCCALYAGHVCYLKAVKWDYKYNMRANVVLGLVQNIVWCGFSAKRYLATKQAWTLIPVVFVVWLSLAMSLELFDFPPIWGSLDAHALWHLGTIGPVTLWYRFLVRDALDHTAGPKKFLA